MKFFRLFVLALISSVAVLSSASAQLENLIRVKFEDIEFQACQFATDSHKLSFKVDEVFPKEDGNRPSFRAVDRIVVYYSRGASSHPTDIVAVEMRRSDQGDFLPISDTYEDVALRAIDPSVATSIRIVAFDQDGNSIGSAIKSIANQWTDFRVKPEFEIREEFTDRDGQLHPAGWHISTIKEGDNYVRRWTLYARVKNVEQFGPNTRTGSTNPFYRRDLILPIFYPNGDADTGFEFTRIFTSSRGLFYRIRPTSQFRDIVLQYPVERLDIRDGRRQVQPSLVGRNVEFRISQGFIGSNCVKYTDDFKFSGSTQLPIITPILDFANEPR